MSRLVFVLILAFLTHQPVAAGPIEWNYTAYVRTATGLSHLYAGRDRLAFDPSGNGSVEPVFSDYVFTTPLTAFARSGSGADTSAFPLFHLPYNDTNNAPKIDTWLADDAPPADTQFLVSLDLHDDKTGDGRRIEFTGSLLASSAGMYPPYFLFNLDMGPAETELRLGDNRYRVESYGGLPDEIDEPAGAWIRITATPGAVNTPEPGTLLLAGFGIGVVGLVRRFGSGRHLPSA